MFYRGDGYGSDDSDSKPTKKRANDSLTARYYNKDDDDDTITQSDDNFSMTSRYCNKD